MTASQAKRRKRNIAIAAGRQSGLSLRALGSAFKLSPARVLAILDDLGDEILEKSERRKILLSSDVLRN